MTENDPVPGTNFADRQPTATGCDGQEARNATTGRLVEAARIELATSCSQSRRAPAALRLDAPL